MKNRLECRVEGGSMCTLVNERALVVPVNVTGVTKMPHLKLGGHWKPVKGDWDHEKTDKKLYLKLKDFCPGPLDMKIKNNQDGIDLLLNCPCCQLTSKFYPFSAARKKLVDFKIKLSKCIFNAGIREKDRDWDYFESKYVLDSKSKKVFGIFTGNYLNIKGQEEGYDYPVFLAFIRDGRLKNVALEAAHFLLQDIKNISQELEEKMKKRLK